MRGVGKTVVNLNLLAKIKRIQINSILKMSSEQWKKSLNSEFIVEFDGDSESLSIHNEIDAKKLAQSLLGISGTLEESNRTLHGIESEIFVKVKGSFKPGSFIVQIVLLLNSGGFQALANLTSILGFCGYSSDSLIQFFKKTKGNKIIEKSNIGDDSFQVIVENSPGAIIVNRLVMNIYEDQKTRKELSKIPEVFENNGIKEMRFFSPSYEPEVIHKDEAKIFLLPEVDPLAVKEDQDFFIITQSNFEGKKTGWRFSFGHSSDKKIQDFSADVLDENFLEKVKQRKEWITQDTVIKAKYRKTMKKIDRLTVHWEILDVIEVIPFRAIDKKISDFLD